MAFFSKKTENKKAGKVEAPKLKTASERNIGRDLSAILKKPHITEKAVRASEGRVYVFEVKSGATKFDVRDAVKKVYGATPAAVKIVNKKPRQYHSRSRGRTVKVRGQRKAYVYLKEGDSINFA